MRYIPIFVFCLFILSACFRQVEDPSSVLSSQSIDSTPNYQATATKIITDATATAVSLIDAGCLPQESTRWLITLRFEGESIDPDTSFARNQSYRNNWLCDGHYLLEHIEYEIDVPYEGEPAETDFIALLDDIVLWLEDYPADSLPPVAPQVLITFHRSDASFEESVATAFSWKFSYSAMVSASDLGLTGADLAEALGIAAP
jgi:hypothetical protein